MQLQEREREREREEGQPPKGFSKDTISRCVFRKEEEAPSWAFLKTLLAAAGEKKRRERERERKKERKKKERERDNREERQPPKGFSKGTISRCVFRKEEEAPSRAFLKTLSAAERERDATS